MKGLVIKICAATICFLLTHCSSFAQEINKLKLTFAGKTYDYFETKPTIPVKGLLILLPSAGEKPKSIFGKTALPKLITASGYITITLEIAPRMFADDECISELNELLKIKTAQYDLTYKDVVIGGLSVGGAMALCYTEYLNSQKQPVKLKAVLAIDPPADMARVYASAQKEMEYNCPLIAREGKSGKASLDEAMGGSPESSPDAYLRRSTYSAQAPDGGNVRFLKDVPVRLYSEPDLEYVRKTYCAELQFFNLNAYDLEKMIVTLKSLGNTRSAYITTQGKGFHSWNIVDAQDCANWIMAL
ncbi:hypothetical protein SAMN05216464_102210 [Mucilaginibacter pineti]|uniref:Pimeloyl-ACP methyl ester carboxylesterase n=1 Tax=Mucilaginibacter pineti TaxID=1391627 RepID=A0A1G6WK34_9SPHI|nr:hypothetical protein [Mucilaginibacter pineti]SDD66139.1 hypothetical protein SAMN05216464_102210 [Mucilaginibacter pineti]